MQKNSIWKVKDGPLEEMMVVFSLSSSHFPFKLDEIIKRNFQAGWRCRGTLGLAPARTFGLVGGFGDGCAR